MSIEIIGSNDSKIKLITEDKIESIINEKEITYNLYKKKYLNNKNNNNEIQISEHLYKQLIKSFYKYDELQSYNYNYYKFKIYLDKISKLSNIIDYVNIFFIENNVFNNLNCAILKILKKIFKEYKIEYIELNNNYYLDLLILIHLLKNNKNKEKNELEDTINKLEDDINKLNNYILNNVSIIKIKQSTNKINILEDYNDSDIILILDNYLNNIKSIKGNILKIDLLINIIIEDIYKFYNLV